MKVWRIVCAFPALVALAGAALILWAESVYFRWKNRREYDAERNDDETGGIW